jgi:hypothetical protein
MTGLVYTCGYWLTRSVCDRFRMEAIVGRSIAKAVKDIPQSEQRSEIERLWKDKAFVAHAMEHPEPDPRCARDPYHLCIYGTFVFFGLLWAVWHYWIVPWALGH